MAVHRWKDLNEKRLLKRGARKAPRFSLARIAALCFLLALMFCAGFSCIAAVVAGHLDHAFVALVFGLLGALWFLDILS